MEYGTEKTREVSQLLLVDDITLVADTREKRQNLVT